MRISFSRNLHRTLWTGAVLATVLVAGSLLLARRSPDDPPALSARVLARLKVKPATARSDGAPALPSVGDLLPGLEARVTDDPADTGARLLLAQAYAEIGERERALQAVASVRRAEPRNALAAFVQAAVLQDGSAADLQRAFDLYDESVRLDAALGVMARLYQGRVRERQGEIPAALEIWRRQVRQLAADDPHRATFEAEIARLSPARARQ